MFKEKQTKHSNSKTIAKILQKPEHLKTKLKDFAQIKIFIQYNFNPKSILGF